MAASRKHTPVAVGKVLSDARGALGQLHDRARELARADRLLAPLLTAPLRDHVRTCALHGHQLVLQVDAPVWSTRLRLLQPELLRALRQLPSPMCDVTALRITVVAPAAPAGPESRKASMSAAAARGIAQCAEAQADPALRDSLARLSRRS